MSLQAKEAEKEKKGNKHTSLFILTCILGKPRSDADLQRLAWRLEDRHVSLTRDKSDLPGATATQKAPVLLLQLHLQSENDMHFHFWRVSGCWISKLQTVCLLVCQLLHLFFDVFTHVLLNFSGSFLCVFSSNLWASKLMNSVLKTHSSRLSYSCSWSIRKSSCIGLKVRTKNPENAECDKRQKLS